MFIVRCLVYIYVYLLLYKFVDVIAVIKSISKIETVRKGPRLDKKRDIIIFDDSNYMVSRKTNGYKKKIGYKV